MDTTQMRVTEGYDESVWLNHNDPKDTNWICKHTYGFQRDENGVTKMVLGVFPEIGAVVQSVDGRYYRIDEDKSVRRLSPEEVEQYA